MHCPPCTPVKTFCVVGNRCLQCVESIFGNLPQFAKPGVKESLNRFSWYFCLHLFGYFGLVSSLFVSVGVCFTAELLMVVTSKHTLEDRFDGGRRSILVSMNPFFLISGQMGKKLLSANSTVTVFAEFLLH